MEFVLRWYFCPFWPPSSPPAMFFCWFKFFLNFLSEPDGGKRSRFIFLFKFKFNCFNIVEFLLLWSLRPFWLPSPSPATSTSSPLTWTLNSGLPELSPSWKSGFLSWKREYIFQLWKKLNEILPKLCWWSFHDHVQDFLSEEHYWTEQTGGGRTGRKWKSFS